jgi:hypothetical protein
LSGGFNVNFQMDENVMHFLNSKGAKGVDRGEEVYLHRVLDALMIRVMPEEDQQSTGIVDFEIEAQVLAL